MFYIILFLQAHTPTRDGGQVSSDPVRGSQQSSQPPADIQGGRDDSIAFRNGTRCGKQVFDILWVGSDMGSDDEQHTFLWSKDIRDSYWKLVMDGAPTLWVRSCRAEVDLGQVLEAVVDMLQNFHGVECVQAADLVITYKGQVQSGEELLVGYPGTPGRRCSSSRWLSPCLRSWKTIVAWSGNAKSATTLETRGEKWCKQRKSHVGQWDTPSSSTKNNLLRTLVTTMTVIQDMEISLSHSICPTTPSNSLSFYKRWQVHQFCNCNFAPLFGQCLKENIFFTWGLEG